MRKSRVPRIISSGIPASCHSLWDYRGSNGPTNMRTSNQQTRFSKKDLHWLSSRLCRVNRDKALPTSRLYGDRRSYGRRWGVHWSWWSHQIRHGKPSGPWLRNTTGGWPSSKHRQYRKLSLRRAVILLVILIINVEDGRLPQAHL